MCGISVIISKNNENILPFLLKSIQLLENRGYDSTGIAFFFNNKIEIIKQIKSDNIDTIEYINNYINEKKFNSNIGIAHTRWATHGGITIENTHPHTSLDKNIILIHNGIIENYIDLKNFLLEKNVIFNSETDSEIICKLIEYYNSIEYNTSKSIEITCNNLQGTWALAIIDVKENSIYLTKNGSPLLVGYNEKIIMASSEIYGFNNYVNNYTKLKNKNIYKIYNNTFSQISSGDNEFKFNKINFDDKISIGKYKYWTLKEIFDQPNSIMNAINNGGRIHNNKIKLGGLEKIKKNIDKVENIILLGCGTSFNACLIAKIYFDEFKIFNTVQVFDAAEFKDTDIPRIGLSMVLFCSQSGETQDLYKNISICRYKHCITIGVINVVESIIATEVDCGVYLNAGREISVASTKSFTSMLIILSLISIYLFQNKYINNNENLFIDKKIQDIRNLSTSILDLLSINSLNKIDNIKNIVLEKLKITKSNSIFILGRGKMFPIAREAALKIKEISYIHCEAYHGAALKHGPLALIEKDICVFFIIDEINKIEMLNCYHEVKARNGFCIIITEILELNLLNGENTLVLNVEKILYQEILFIIVFQYLAYQLSISKNINPDKPRNLAKVVTVQ